MATGRIGVTPTLGTRWSKAPAGGTTSLSGLDDNSVALVYSVGYEQVYRNGVLLSRGNDYTATDGNSITLTDATIAGDIIEVFANELVPLTDAISKGQFTAKGALLSATAASTPAVLTVGSNDQVLTADSSTSTGLKWATAGGGKVKQIISASTTTATTIASTTFTDTTITATITPTSASNKILVLVSAHYYHSRSAVESAMGGRLLRGATVIANFDEELNQIQITGATAVSGRGNAPIIWLDSPATTSATTYKVQGKVGNTANSGTCTYQFNSLPSSIILLEVEA